MSWAIIVILLGLVFIGWCILAPTPSENYAQKEDYQSLAYNGYDLETPHFPVGYPPHYQLAPHPHWSELPPGMYNRFSQWHPGYHTHTWTFNKRPGTDLRVWPRNVWARNNGTYYHIDNGTIRDRMYDYYGRF